MENSVIERINRVEEYLRKENDEDPLIVNYREIGDFSNISSILYSHFSSRFSTRTKTSLCAAPGRSLGDLYRIVLYFLPNTTLLEMINVLSDNYMDMGVESFICSDIGRRVYNRNFFSNRVVYTGEPIDEFGINWESILEEDIINNKLAEDYYDVDDYNSLEDVLNEEYGSNHNSGDLIMIEIWKKKIKI